MNGRVNPGGYDCPERCGSVLETPGQLGGHVTACRRRTRERREAIDEWKAVPTDDERLDPSQMRPWICTVAMFYVIVLATCPGEAKGAASYWIGRARGGLAPEHRLDQIKVREAKPEDLDTWRVMRRQQSEGAKMLRTTA